MSASREVFIDGEQVPVSPALETPGTALTTETATVSVSRDMPSFVCSQSAAPAGTVSSVPSTVVQDTTTSTSATVADLHAEGIYFCSEIGSFVCRKEECGCEVPSNRKQFRVHLKRKAHSVESVTQAERLWQIASATLNSSFMCSNSTTEDVGSSGAAAGEERRRLAKKYREGGWHVGILPPIQGLRTVSARKCLSCNKLFESSEGLRQHARKAHESVLSRSFLKTLPTVQCQSLFELKKCKRLFRVIATSDQQHPEEEEQRNPMVLLRDALSRYEPGQLSGLMSGGQQHEQLRQQQQQVQQEDRSRSSFVSIARCPERLQSFNITMREAWVLARCAEHYRHPQSPDYCGILDYSLEKALYERANFLLQATNLYLSQARAEFQNIDSFYSLLFAIGTPGMRSEKKPFRFLDADAQGLRSQLTYARHARIILFVVCRVVRKAERFPNIVISQVLRTNVEALVALDPSTVMLGGGNEAGNDCQQTEMVLKMLHQVFYSILFEKSSVYRGSTNLLASLVAACLCVGGGVDGGNSGQRLYFRRGNQVSPFTTAILYTTSCCALLQIRKYSTVAAVAAPDNHANDDQLEEEQEERIVSETLRALSPGSTYGLTVFCELRSMCATVRLEETAYHPFRPCTIHPKCGISEGTEFSIDSLGGCVKRMQTDLYRLIFRVALRDITLVEDFPAKCAGIVDDTSCSVRGYWALSDLRNKSFVESCVAQVSQHVLPLLVAEWDGVPRWCAMVKRDIVPLLLTVLHLVGGAPGRGTEIEAMELRNTASCFRAIFFDGSEIMLVPRFMKTRSVKRGNMSFLSRHLDLRTSLLFKAFFLLIYPLYVVCDAHIRNPTAATALPHASSTSSPLPLQPPPPPPPPPDAAVMDSLCVGAIARGKVAEVVGKCFAKYDIPFTFSGYRHWQRGYIKMQGKRYLSYLNQYGTGSEMDGVLYPEGYNSDEDEDADQRHIIDPIHASIRQAGHSSVTANFAYAQSRRFGDKTSLDGMAEAIRLFREASHMWHCELGLRSQEQPRVPDTRFPSNQQRRTDIGVSGDGAVAVAAHNDFSNQRSAQLESVAENILECVQELVSSQRSHQEHDPIGTSNSVLPEQPNILSVRTLNTSPQPHPQLQPPEVPPETRESPSDNNMEEECQRSAVPISSRVARSTPAVPPPPPQPLPSSSSCPAPDSPEQIETIEISDDGSIEADVVYTDEECCDEDDVVFNDEEYNGANETVAASPIPLPPVSCVSPDRHQQQPPFRTVFDSPAPPPESASRRILASVSGLQFNPIQALRQCLRDEQSEFRSSEQKEAMVAVAQRRSDLAIMLATGCGKTAVIMGPVLLEPGYTVWIAPLRALLVETRSRLRNAGIEVFTVDSVSEEVERLGNVLLIGPEELAKQPVCTVIAQLSLRNLLNRVVIDEAHIVVFSWHYRECMVRIQSLEHTTSSDCPRVLLTATAPPPLLRKICIACGVNESGLEVIRGDPCRPNLKLSVTYLSRTDKQYLVSRICSTVDSICARWVRESIAHARLLVVCLSISHCSEIHNALLEYGNNKVPSIVQVLQYNSRMSPEEQNKALSIWASDFGTPVSCTNPPFTAAVSNRGDVAASGGCNGNTVNVRWRVMCATDGFCTGTDTSNIRAVIVAGGCRSVVEFWQACGRGGRGGEQCDVVVLYHSHHCVWSGGVGRANTNQVGVEERGDFLKWIDQGDGSCRRKKVEMFLHGLPVYKTCLERRADEQQQSRFFSESVQLCDMCERIQESFHRADGHGGGGGSGGSDRGDGRCAHVREKQPRQVSSSLLIPHQQVVRISPTPSEVEDAKKLRSEKTLHFSKQVARMRRWGRVLVDVCVECLVYHVTQGREGSWWNRPGVITSLRSCGRGVSCELVRSTCWRCHQVGHSAKSCPVLQSIQCADRIACRECFLETVIGQGVHRASEYGRNGACPFESLTSIALICFRYRSLRTKLEQEFHQHFPHTASYVDWLLYDSFGQPPSLFDVLDWVHKECSLEHLGLAL